MPTISVIIPIYNEKEHIRRCLDSILRSDFDKERMEVLLVDGGSTDGTLEIIGEYRKRYPFIRLLPNPDKIVPKAMNIGIEAASGEYIVRLDAHASYPEEYFSRLVRYHRELDADNVGGVIRTAVRRETPVAHAIRNVLSDRLGVGSAFRSGVREISEVDTVPFGCYRKEIFDKIGPYDERLVRNQDIELNKRLKKAGGRIFLVPDIECTYYARDTYQALARNNFANGRWNMLTAFLTKSFRSLSLRHYAPLLFLLALVLPLFCCYEVALGIFLLYLIVISVRSCQIAKNTTCPNQILAFLTLHFSYAAGELIGLLEVLKLILKGKRQ